MRQGSTYIFHALQKFMQKMKQIDRPQHTDDFCSSWGRSGEGKREQEAEVGKDEVKGLKV